MNEIEKGPTKKEIRQADQEALTQQEKFVEKMIKQHNKGGSYGHAADIANLTDWVEEIRRIRNERLGK